MSLEPLPVFTARDLEPFDPELLSLIAADDNDMLLPMEDDTPMKKVVDDYAPLNPMSTPTAVDAFNPGFSRLEVQDLMNLLAPDVTRIPAITRSCSEPIKKLGKRTKKCTYAARRREVAFLRKEAMVLENSLNSMRKCCKVSSLTREQAEREAYELAKAQAENDRLRAMVSTQEAKIRKADAYMISVNHQGLASSP
ncbi:hypothetical protein BBO99_00004190 [Phytophthora kernoviae]|uniref:Uncharacterized protein n=2 Tax=Phytophthora kernoviae TaxID=325452 RepID=A0A3R7JV18_9STRA|nr:hypothetical protein G195_008652 [Phytophthora kernoviae 00238/432]KAG2522577.1 hypothetical protein JM18_003500 [Phytophthora kernoviae]KAG2526175.1 hypothetical protein JM16_004026 [Phytophthora kernoviae]RLM97655.1 hypothetical protein BBI17_004036 [Phytophthora kernoviae]RLN80847.1 hypothetical protein BBO99_00004190 [Phytophthora kernoviae]